MEVDASMFLRFSMATIDVFVASRTKILFTQRGFPNFASATLSSIRNANSLQRKMGLRLKPSTQIDENRELTIGVSERQIRG